MAQVGAAPMAPHMLSWGTLQVPEVTINEAPPIPIRSPLRSQPVQPLQIQPLQIQTDVDSHPWIRDSMTISRRTSFDGERTASPTDSASIYSQDDQPSELGSPATLTDETRDSDDSSSGPSTPRMEFQSDAHFFQQHYDSENCSCDSCDKMSKSRESSIGIIYLAPPVKQAPGRAPRSFISRADSSDASSIVSAIPSRASSIRAFGRSRKARSEQIGQQLTNLDISEVDTDEILPHPAVRPLNFNGTNRMIARADSRASSGDSTRYTSRSLSTRSRPSTVLSMRELIAPSFTSTIASRFIRAPSIVEDDDDAAMPPAIGMTRPVQVKSKSNPKKFSLKYKLGDVMNVLYAGY